MLGDTTENFRQTTDKKMFTIKDQETTVRNMEGKAKTAQTVQFVSSEELLQESSLLQASLLEKFEDAIRQHERACTEKCTLEEKLKTTAKSSEQECEISSVAAKAVLRT